MPAASSPSFGGAVLHPIGFGAWRLLGLCLTIGARVRHPALKGPFGFMALGEGRVLRCWAKAVILANLRTLLAASLQAEGEHLRAGVCA